jgi:hypothetical protein
MSTANHVADADVPKVTPFSFGWGQGGDTPIEVKAQVVAVAAPPEKLILLQVAAREMFDRRRESW